MLYRETGLEGAYVIDLEKRGDERGFFARFFCAEEFAKMGLKSQFVQVNNSLSAQKGTLRGLHYQLAPKAEVKVVRCIQGALWDVIVDVRPNSPTYKKWFGTELTAENRRMMYVPEGFAHGFTTLEDNTEALYLVSEVYSPTHERGIRYDDPALQIQWPLSPVVISEKDLNHPLFDACAATTR